MKNKINLIWKELEAKKDRPKYASNIIKIDYQEFQKKIEEQNEKYIKNIITSLYNGDIYILKNAFSKTFMYELIEKVYKIFHTTESSFHKMKEGCPDFHRMIDQELAKNYAFPSVRHSYYFFPWNEDPLNAISEINKRWRLIKQLIGLDKYAYENNTPKDGVVDRFQIARYLPGIGEAVMHTDPYENQRTFISIYMSKKGEHFNQGGFYVVKKDNKVFDTETEVDVGDMSIGYATVMHGVEVVDPDKKPDWKAKDGRWWMGLYSNSSDTVKRRAIGKAANLSLKIK